MIEEKIVVSDTNIFFDLLSVDLLDAFFQLPCESETTNVKNGLKSGKNEKILSGRWFRMSEYKKVKLG